MPPTGRIDISIVGDDKGVQLLLRRLETGFSPAGMALFLGSTIGPYLQQRAKQRFDNEGDDVVGKWSPLKASTQEIRRTGPWAVGAAHPINVRTHEMEKYVTGSQGNVIPSGPMSVLTFPDPSRGGGGKELRKKMRTAQLGKKGKGQANTPARPVISLGVQDLTFTIGALAMYAQRVGKGQRR